jgi:hypothetical protein
VNVARQMQSFGLKTLGHLVVSSFGARRPGAAGRRLLTEHATHKGRP